MADPYALDEEALLREACEATGLSDYGSDDFRPGLRMLIDTYRSHPYTEKGRKRNRRRLVSLLSTRLQLEEAWKRFPEVRERPVRRPVVLTGFPRSGTSALFNLLASDPAARPLRLWETQFPYPDEGWSPEKRGLPDPRRDAIEAYYARGREKNPEFTRIHYASADTPEECVLLHAYAFGGVQNGVEVMMEPYGSWYREQDLHGIYTYERSILQLLDWQRPGERWLLKAPAHLWGLEALVETFPDVAVVWSHRSPLRAVASVCSMTEALAATREGLDPRELGPVVMDFYATSLERGLAARDRLGPERFVDVTHDELVGDAAAVARRIYAHFGLPLDARVDEALARHAAENPPGRHGSHEYGLEAFGLGVEDVKRRFAPYMERFGLAWE